MWQNRRQDRLLHEILPRELRVPRLRRRGRQVKAQGVGVVFAQEVGHVDGSAAALAELAALKVEVFSDMVWKIRLP